MHKRVTPPKLSAKTGLSRRSEQRICANFIGAGPRKPGCEGAAAVRRHSL